MFSAIVRVALSLFGTQQTKPTNADNRGCCIMNDIKFNFVGEKICLEWVNFQRCCWWLH